ncbi:hypothetical protein ACRE_069180 [Hapsidospora chrysogenum ATCC 11550]|uniref:CENP-V/GFA domain-containing protein n=1 Tax=Hapsidospora chrysogenum (strain ATCC 11550 / CBS 779.69 / DSM 880 / IAM 14645 / JCM 23072 / IMI 49137) TaxID=857340 RepID=A0A086SZ15_HAPC1|nr:hypothetical protein ACRE_069180 [Hapsidospora chrysogenum ATCC 11550]
MPLPSQPLILTGGCSCGAIRYRIAVPESSSRPPVPFFPDGHDPMPNPVSCHCNDCRRATASLLPVIFLQCPAPMVTVSVLEESPDEQGNGQQQHGGRFVDVLAEGYDQVATDAKRPPYLPAVDVLRASSTSTSTGTQDNAAKKTWLRFYHSTSCSPTASRTFCGRCGTQVAFHMALEPWHCTSGKLPDSFSDIIDINGGTFDRDVLDQEGWLDPGVEVNFRSGTALGKKVAASAKGMGHVPKMYGFVAAEGVATKEELERLAQ